MNELWHILDRAAIHFAASCSLVLIVFFGLRTVSRRLVTKWLPIRWEPTLLFAALFVFALSTMREAWDVAAGQSLIKAATDYISWLLGCGVSVWGLYRFKTSDL